MKEGTEGQSTQGKRTDAINASFRSKKGCYCGFVKFGRQFCSTKCARTAQPTPQQDAAY